jgi:UDP-N-acetyl-D-mannosaminuronic acid dehydrogenase
MSNEKSLLEKVQNGNVTICVLGLGRVGLPLASVFSTKGLKVIGVDINEERLASIKNGKCPFHDPALQENLNESKRIGALEVVNDLEKVKNVIDIIIVTVGTPTTQGNSVDYSQVFTALEEVCKVDLKNKMIIMRSTLPPKTTADIIIPFLENKTGLKTGDDFYLAVCPERILEGKAVKEIQELPEIVGGINQISNDIVTELFRYINPEKKFSYTTITGAELAKLFANVYRYIGFALSNEFAVWAEMYGENASEIINVANYEYSRSNIPEPGFAGGPCLSKDGLFLDNNTTFSSIVSTAWKVNESIPQHVVNKIKESEGNLFGRKIGVLGISFKAGSDDLRNSPSKKLADLFKATGAMVKIHDPFVKDTLTLNEVLDNSEIIIVATNHNEFKNLESEIERRKIKVIYDVWGIYKKENLASVKYLRLGMN